MRGLATFRQYLSAATASLSVVILGTALGWPSPVLVQLGAGDSGLRLGPGDSGLRLGPGEVSWMVSLLYLGNMLSPLPAGRLMDVLGRKGALLALALVPASSWVIIIFADRPWMLYVARFLAGIWSGTVSTITPMYLAEISEPRVRGALSTFVQLMTNFGVLFEYVIGPQVSYKELGYLSGALPIAFIAAFSFMPESPYWLLMKGKKDRAGQSLAWLRGVSHGEEKPELEAMNHAVQEEMSNKKSMKDLLASGNRRALLIVEVLAILQRMSGISALMAYTSTTLPARGAGALTPNDCVIVMGIVWVVSVLVATVLVDSLGRRPLLLISSVGCGFAMFLAGLWFFLDKETELDVSDYYWLPFGSFLIYGLFFCLGLGPIASTVQGECFPTNIKGLASGITSIALALTSFIMNKIYHDIAELAGMYLNYWIFAGTCFISAIFVITCVIETKGKTLHEIQEALNKKAKSKSDNSE